MSRKNRVVWSAIIALGLLVLSYIVGNLPFSIMGEKLLLKKAVAFYGLFHDEKGNEEVLDSALFINVCYDKVMTPMHDTLNGWCGSVPVTDRHKLLELLEFLKDKEDAEQKESGTPYYKYILLDVFFGNDAYTKEDAELFSLISSMDRVVIPYRENEKIADEHLMKKAFLSKYSQFIPVAGFTKYPYYIRSKSKHWEKTLPAKMFEEMTGRKIKKVGPLYFEGWRLAKRSCFLPLDICPNYWHNLGMDLLRDTLTVTQFGHDTTYTGNGFLYRSSKLTKNKYIVIGSHHPKVGDDMHNTFKGDMAGAALCYNAFYSMKEDQYRINYFVVLIMFLAFFALSYFILCGGREMVFATKWFKKLKTGWKMVVFFFLSFFGTVLVLKLLSLIIFVVFGKVVEMLVVSIAFSLLLLIVKFNKQIQ